MGREEIAHPTHKIGLAIQGEALNDLEIAVFQEIFRGMPLGGTGSLASIDPMLAGTGVFVAADELRRKA
jgi:hypothetical protein